MTNKQQAVEMVNGIPVWDGQLAALTQAVDLEALIRENLGDDGLRPSDLTRVTFPREAPAWDVDGDIRQELRGVPLRQAVTRTFYVSEYGDGHDAPDCSSNDGVIGIPADPERNIVYTPEGRELAWGGACMKCPMNQWGSAVDRHGQPTRGKACREYRQIALLEPGAAFPIIVRLPPTQLGPWREFCASVTKALLGISQVVASLTVSKDRENNLSLEAAIVGVLPAETAAQVAGLTQSMHLLTAPQQPVDVEQPEVAGYLDDGAPPIDDAPASVPPVQGALA